MELAKEHQLLIDLDKEDDEDVDSDGDSVMNEEHKKSDGPLADKKPAKKLKHRIDATNLNELKRETNARNFPLI